MGNTLPSIYSQFIHQGHYARYNDELGRRETWQETVDRYIAFFKKRTSTGKTKVPWDDLRQAILNLEVMPSMRALMTAGPALDKDNAAGYNCSYLPIDNPKAFDELMFLSMCGTGVGYSVESRYTNKLPEVPDELHPSDTTIVFKDSKTGWATGYREFMSLLYSGKIPKWDVSKLRPCGARLMTFGGRASGPDPLIDLLKFTTNIFMKARGRRLSTLECHDIVCKIADIVVSGGVRRSALIALTDLNDDKLRHAKSGNWWMENPHRALANISAVYENKPDMSTFMNEWVALHDSRSGERGIFSRKVSQQLASRFGRRDPNLDYGTNPCFTGDTLIAVADGRNAVTIEQLALESQGIKPFTVYAGEAVTWNNQYGVTDKFSHWSKRVCKAVAFQTGVKPVFKVTLSNGDTFQATDEHLLAKPDGSYVMVKNSLGCELAKFFTVKERYRTINAFTDGQSRQHRLIWEQWAHLDSNPKVQSVEYVGTKPVYDLTVPDTSNFYIITRAFDGNADFSRGILVHNCAEILLRPYQFCNLTEVVVRSQDDLLSLQRKVRLASILGTLQSTLSDFRYINKRWKKNTEEERLLGVSLTGIMDNRMLSVPSDDLIAWLQSLRETAVKTNQEFADLLGVERSAAITCVKPSGSVSQLTDTASGIHPRFSKFYIRRVRLSKTDSLAAFMVANGYTAEEDTYNKSNWVFSFPMKAPEGCLTTSDTSAIQQLEHWLIYQDHWCEHKPSITVYVGDDEWLEVGAWVYKHIDRVSGVAFLPRDTGSYRQAPYEAIDEAKYLDLVAAQKSEIDWTQFREESDNTVNARTLACSSGVCEI